VVHGLFVGDRVGLSKWQEEGKKLFLSGKGPRGPKKMTVGLQGLTFALPEPERGGGEGSNLLSTSIGEKSN